MPVPTAMKEIEVKLPAQDFRTTRKRLRELGFLPDGGRMLERNLVLDAPDSKLRRSSQLLRLRCKGDRWWVTWKERPEAGRRHKVRHEVEVEVSPGEPMRDILDRLGYHPVFEYQKYRTEFHQPGALGKALLDETPIGNFIELEGPPRWIDRVARELGYRPEDY